MLGVCARLLERHRPPCLRECPGSARPARDRRGRRAARRTCRAACRRECPHRARRHTESSADRACSAASRWCPCPPTAPRRRGAALWPTWRATSGSVATAVEVEIELSRRVSRRASASPACAGKIHEPGGIVAYSPTLNARSAISTWNRRQPDSALPADLPARCPSTRRRVRSPASVPCGCGASVSGSQRLVRDRRIGGRHDVEVVVRGQRPGHIVVGLAAVLRKILRRRADRPRSCDTAGRGARRYVPAGNDAFLHGQRRGRRDALRCAATCRRETSCATRADRPDPPRSRMRTAPHRRPCARSCSPCDRNCAAASSTASRPGRARRAPPSRCN